MPLPVLIISIINICGGIDHWYLQCMGMSTMDAVQTYSLLSIGDGLVTQIPALLISITAGIVTTRVSSEKAESNLGSEISGQILKQPKALMIAAGFLMGMGILPGFPTAPFMILLQPWALSAMRYGVRGADCWNRAAAPAGSGGITSMATTDS